MSSSSTFSVSRPIGKMRLARAISLSGLCSRREAEKLITRGAVIVNGKVHNEPAHNVSWNDDIIVNDTRLQRSEFFKPLLWRYYKPRGLITTHCDPNNRESVFDSLRQSYPDLPRLISIGRLDINSEGLLLLTNDGQLAQDMMLPSTALKRRYRVRALGNTPANMVERLSKGIRIDNIRYAPVKLIVEMKENNTAANKWYRLALCEGKNREIRKIFEYFNLTISRLQRIGFGSIGIVGLKRGQVEEVPRPSVKKIIDNINRQNDKCASPVADG